jgi:hypothetical protein
MLQVDYVLPNKRNLLKIFVIFFSLIEEDENDGRDLERDEDPEVVRLGNVLPRQSKKNNFEL